MGPLVLAAIGVGALLLMSGKKKTLNLPPSSDTPLDSGMSQEQFNLWRQLMQLEGRPDILRQQAEGYAAAGFANSAARLAAKRQALLAAGVQ